ncbi:MAG: leucine-rich repeat domain-containing protein [Eubacterium sp.]|nr:leucine-rich repeat domain-containing protein [Eubacterium sp.]
MLTILGQIIDINIFAVESKTREILFENFKSTVEETPSGDFKTTLSGSGAVTEHVMLFGDVFILDGITALEKEVFRGNKGVYSVSLPETLKSIGEKCFCTCRDLQEIAIPSSVTSIGKNPFYDCQRLKKIVNNSKVSVDAPKFEDYRRGYDYYVDGKPATKVAPGKTMIGKPHKYKLNLKLNGGKIVGKKMKTYDIVKNTILPRAKKKGYDFVGWTDENDSANGISKLWRADFIVGGKQTRYAQFCKVKMTGKKKSIQIKVTNCNFTHLCIYYSTKKDRSDEKMVKVVKDVSEKRLYYYKEGTDKTITVKGKQKYHKKNYTKSYVSMKLPIFKSKTKYYIRLKSLIPYGEEMEKEYGYSDFFGRRTVRVK